jgi:single-strand DNA-binding protein
MSNLNKVLLIGRVGQDPEVRYTKSGQAVADLRIATNDFWKDKQGQKQERTEWHSIVLWGQQAEFAQNYIKKGRLIFVEGRLQTRDWTDKQNVKHYKTEVVANNVQLLDRPAEGAGAPGGGQRAEGKAYADSSPASGPTSSSNEPEGAYIEDDIPF